MRILTALLKYDYGDPKRGYSTEYLVWIPAFKKTGNDITEFYLEDNGLLENKAQLQERLIESVNKTRPEYVFFMFMRDEVSYETLDEINKISKSINWFCDDQWRFDDYSKFYAKHLTYCLTTDKFCLQKYSDNGFQNVKLVHWTPPFDLMDLDIENVKYEFDISFIGGKNYSREWIVSELEKTGLKVHCFGQGWDNGRVTYERMREIFLRTKINLNLSNSNPVEISYRKFWKKQRIADLKKDLMRARNPFRKWKLFWEIQNIKSGKLDVSDGTKNQEQVKARNFEIAGCGGFQISKMALGLEYFYNIGNEIIVYNTLDELKILIDYYLKNESERIKMARNSFERTRKYNLTDHLIEIFNGLKSHP